MDLQDVLHSKHLLEVIEVIDYHLENRPRGKPSKIWKDQLNALIKRVNKERKMVIFKEI